MKKWIKKRKKDREAQRAYVIEHIFCEVCLAEGRGERLATQVHEIQYKSQLGKCEDGNMISVCYEDHQRAHFLKKPWLSKKELFEIKRKVKK